ncbi:Rna-binding protein [Thalictrum thalictroides]|uniref:Rna-binding protein n=1 Tax=Thalictrum thalictroides TaxID=46969 RepID=A0A7J6UYS9_THATH|nr:Rna-binding protein [Thalictrum thalictroides]
MIPGSVAVSVSHLRPPPPPPGSMYQIPNPYGQQMPNGYSTVPPPAPQGTIPAPGVLRYPTAYTPMMRPAFHPRPPGAIGMLQPLVRPPVPGIRGVPPASAPLVRPVVPIVAPTEKPQTTVYVGKIASTVENDFILSLLRLCGSVKSWKRAQDPSNGTPRGFGFCEFESAEGVLRALRLLSKFSVDGQELVLNVNQATREYLERYVEKKTEREKLKEIEAEATKKDEESAPGVEKNEPSKPLVEESKEENVTVNKETQENSQNFGIVTDEDREADRDALEKLQNMLEERLKTKPLPPPPAQLPPDGSAKSNSDVPTKSRDGDSDVEILKNGDDKNDDEMTSENKPSSEHDRPETNSPDRNRKSDRRSRERDRERDLKRDKERELERYEKERERERVRRERERDMKIREAERLYKERLKEWESKEKARAYQRQLEKKREKEREEEREREIMDQEDETDDDDRKRRRRSSVLEEKRKKRKREREEDKADRLREEEEISEAKKRKLEEEKQKEDAKLLSSKTPNSSEKPMMEELTAECRANAVEQSYDSDSGFVNHSDDTIMKNGVGDDSAMSSITVSDTRQSSAAPTRKLGFGLVGSGKRTAVPSVFHEEDEDDADKDKKMRPLVPIDYSTEELQAVQTPTSGTPPPNLAAAAEFAKRISNVNPKEEKYEGERERNRRTSDRSSQRDRDRSDDDRHRARDEYKEKTTDRDRERDHVPDKLKTQENKKLLDAKQLIDMIPKTKEELFLYEINWAVYDKHELQERMRPWISKKITEFLGEEETTLVDYIVSKTKEHVRASEMLELLQAILDDEAEMFVLKMWRMLIFEIKKVETGLALKPKA